MINSTITPNEIFDALTGLKSNLEENFVAIGELLSITKKEKLYLGKGAKTFNEFVQYEYAMSTATANRLIGIYDLFIKHLKLDPQQVQEIGIDKLSIIKPLISKAEYDVQTQWVETAEELHLEELRVRVKEIRDAEKLANKTLKDILVEQYLEDMKEFFNCSGKEVDYKLALYFQTADLGYIEIIIKDKQRKFEEEIQGDN
jgi:hypothetical protein